MARFKINYGDPSDPTREIVHGNGIRIEPMNKQGTRKLAVHDEDGEATAIYTVGPDHVLTYEVEDQ